MDHGILLVLLLEICWFGNKFVYGVMAFKMHNFFLSKEVLEHVDQDLWSGSSNFIAHHVLVVMPLE